MIIIIIVLIIVISLGALWAAGFWLIQDFAVADENIKKIKRALIIFPHADDETNTAGFIWRLSKQGTHVTLVILTKGERGYPDAQPQLKLKDIRTQEVTRAAHILGIDQLIQEDFGDGELANKRPRIRARLAEVLQQTKPDLVITYDRTGMYGHGDHIFCSEIVTDLVLAQHPQTTLWYTTLPQQLSAMLSLPEHLAKDPAWITKQALPNTKVYIGLGVFAKIRAVYAHKSQYHSFRSSIPFHLPLWFAYSMQLFEYFAKTQE